MLDSNPPEASSIFRRARAIVPVLNSNIRLPTTTAWPIAAMPVPPLQPPHLHPRRRNHNWFISSAHTPADIAQAVAVAEECFAIVAKEIAPGELP